MAKERRDPPTLGITDHGQLNQALNMPTEMFREANPDLEVRWVYAPEGKKDGNSKVKARIKGYKRVTAEDFGVDEDFLDAEGSVRVGDLILYATSKDKHKDNVRDLKARADAEKKRVKGDFQAQMENVQVAGSDGMIHKPKATGSLNLVDEDVEIPNPAKSEED